MIHLDTTNRLIIDTETGAFWRYTGSAASMVVFLGGRAKLAFARGSWKTVLERLTAFLRGAIASIDLHPALEAVVETWARLGAFVDDVAGVIHGAAPLGIRVLHQGRRLKPGAWVPHDDEVFVDVFEVA